MCTRKEGEPLWAYLLRYAVEQPRTLLAVIGIIAACVLYTDLKGFMAEQTKAYAEIVKELQAVKVELHETKVETHESNVRLSELEHWHKLESQKTAGK